MRSLALLALLGLAGCVTSPIVLEYDKRDNAKAMGLGGGESVYLKKVSIDPEFYGRGCTKIEVGKDGNLAVVIQSDASSDWGGFRSAYAVAPEIVNAVASIVSGPLDIIKGVLGIPPRSMPAPSALSGCHGVVEE